MSEGRAALSGALACLLLSSCDPCGTTIGCERPPAVVVAGQIVDESTGRPVAGVRVTLRADSGVAAGESASLTTDDGSFQQQLSASETGTARLTVTVHRPGKPAYQRPGILAEATTQAGDGLVLPLWVDARPRFPYVIITFAGVPSNGVPGIELEFQRTGGVVLYSDSGPVDRVTGVTGENGWSFLMASTWSEVVGEVVGDLTVRVPGVTEFVIQGATFASSERFRPAFLFITIPIS